MRSSEIDTSARVDGPVALVPDGNALPAACSMISLHHAIQRCGALQLQASLLGAATHAGECTDETPQDGLHRVTIFVLRAVRSVPLVRERRLFTLSASHVAELNCLEHWFSCLSCVSQLCVAPQKMNHVSVEINAAATPHHALTSGSSDMPPRYNILRISNRNPCFHRIVKSDVPHTPTFA
jgi:hypothetical protein